MDCSGIADHLSPLLDGELEHDKAERVRAHLERCPRCRKSYQHHMSVKRVLSRKLLFEKAPPGLRSAILDRLDSAPGGDFLYAFVAKLRAMPPVAAGLALILLIVIYSSIVLLVRSDRLPPLVLGMMSNYAKAYQPPLEINTGDAEEVAQTMSVMMEKEITVADLKGMWFFLMGGRKCLLCSSPAIEIRYLHPAGNLSFFIVSEVGQSEIARLCRSGTLKQKEVGGKRYLCCQMKFGRAVLWWKGEDIFAVTSDSCLPSVCLLDAAEGIRSALVRQD